MITVRHAVPVPRPRPIAMITGSSAACSAVSMRPAALAPARTACPAVFMALAFWTWLWGPMGGFLSSPLLIVALVLKEHLMPVESPQLPPD